MDKVAGILHRFLPQAHAEPGIKLFQISRGKDDAAQFLFYEVFADEPLSPPIRPASTSRH